MTARRVLAEYITLARNCHRARLLDAFPSPAIPVLSRSDCSNGNVGMPLTPPLRLLAPGKSSWTTNVSNKINIPPRTLRLIHPVVEGPPLASGFDLRAGNITIVVPNIIAGRHFITCKSAALVSTYRQVCHLIWVLLVFGDSGNDSPLFNIVAA